MPSDHTSTLPSYWPSSIARITSGAIQYGVPTNELAGLTADAEPKSAALKSHHIIQSSEMVDEIKILGMKLDRNLSVDNHIRAWQHICPSISEDMAKMVTWVHVCWLSPWQCILVRHIRKTCIDNKVHCMGTHIPFTMLSASESWTQFNQQLIHFSRMACPIYSQHWQT